MNNKLFARIAAAAVGVSMLSTFVFADTAVPTIDVAGGELSFMNGTTNIIAEHINGDAAYVTMMSYLISKADKDTWEAATEKVVPTPVDTNIIALDQVKSDELSQLNSVKLLAEKLTVEGYPAAVVRTGDSNGGGNTWVIALAEDGNGYTITFIAGMGKIGDASTATNTTTADGTVTPVDNPETGKAGLTFQYWATKDATGAYTKFDPTTTKVTADTELYAVYQIKVGDINLDGKVDATDASTAKSYFSIGGKKSEKPANQANFKAANPSFYLADNGSLFVGLNGAAIAVGDLNADGKADATDASMAKSYFSIGGKKSERPTNQANFKAANPTFDFDGSPIYVVSK